jgi:hypothetical protein
MKHRLKSARILDVCCGGRMFWFDKTNPLALFMDKRREQHHFPGNRTVTINPDIQACFTRLPFAANRFSMVIFDPPHLTRAGSGWLAKKYGKLEGDWKSELRQGFSECFRVLKTNGTLIFKWNEVQVPVSQILPLAVRKPLFGNRCGKAARTHWIVFMKL